MKQNSIQSKYPDIAKEWDYKQNDQLTPDSVGYGSTKNVHWICPKGHLYQARVYSRTLQNTGCPICAGRVVIPGYNDLQTLRPEIAAEWHPTKNGDLLPSQVGLGSNKKVWWLCKSCGYEWLTMVNTRGRGRGCPKCGRILARNNRINTYIDRNGSLAERFPDIAAEWDNDHNSPMTSEMVSPGSDQKVWWLCKQGHLFQATISSRTINGNGCPYCAGQKAITGVNDLLTTHPEVTEIWDYDKNKKGPEFFLARSNKKVWWTCSLGHSYQAIINDKITRKDGCPYCSGRRVLQGFNDLATVSPQIAEEWNYGKNNEIVFHGKIVSPQNITAGCNLKVWWACKECHNEWMASVNDRTHDYGCPYCSGRKVKVGFNDLESLRPDLARQWHPTRNKSLSPKDVTVGSNKKVWWLCPECKGEWHQSINERNQGRNCPFCAGKAVLQGYNDLETTNPEISAMWHRVKNGDLSPQMVTKGSNKKVWWHCPVCNYEWKGMINGINKCPVCVGQAIKVGFNDLGTTFPDVAREWHPTKNGALTPQNVTQGTSKKVWWICSTCGYEWQTAVCNRTQGHRCPRCTAALHTSFPEQSVLYYMLQRFEAINRFNYEGTEIDVYLPATKIGIEYNGWYYHHKKWDKDEVKKRRLQDKGVRLIRLIEDSKHYVDGDDIHLNPRIKADQIGGLDWGIQQLFVILGEESPMIDTTVDKFKIREQYIHEKKDNFAALFPEIAKQWHPTKNGTLIPKYFLPNSNEKVWWKCPVCGGEWQAVISGRTRRSGCPICAGHKVQKEINGLSTTNPELVSEWDFDKNTQIGLDIDKLTKGSNKQAFWVCKECGFSWKTGIYSRATRGMGCPECKKTQNAKKLVEKAAKKHSLTDDFPLIAAEWDYSKNDPLLPQNYAPGSNKKMWWICSQCGYEWATKICHRTEGHGCPACARKKVWEIRKSRKK